MNSNSSLQISSIDSQIEGSSTLLTRTLYNNATKNSIKDLQPLGVLKLIKKLVIVYKKFITYFLNIQKKKNLASRAPFLNLPQFG